MAFRLFEGIDCKIMRIGVQLDIFYLKSSCHRGVFQESRDVKEVKINKLEVTWHGPNYAKE